jgi:hypothetical protein
LLYSPAVRVHAQLLALVASLTLATPARAGLGALRLTVEPGVGALTPPRDGQTWGFCGGATFAVALTDQLWVQVHGDRKVFPGHEPALAASALGLTLTYNVDVLYVTPYLEAGGSWVWIARQDGIGAAANELVPVLGVGLDVTWWGWLLAGLGVRYYPVFESDLMNSPAYATLHLRAGVVFEPSLGE